MFWQPDDELEREYKWVLVKHPARWKRLGGRGNEGAVSVCEGDGGRCTYLQAAGYSPVHGD